MVDVEEIRYERRYDIGVCNLTDEKKKWSESCKDGFKCREHISRKPYMVCFQCKEWKGIGKLEQIMLETEETKEIVVNGHRTMVVL
jgi:Flp pilus assembly CpaF family ATPase